MIRTSSLGGVYIFYYLNYSIIIKIHLDEGGKRGSVIHTSSLGGVQCFIIHIIVLLYIVYTYV